MLEVPGVVVIPTYQGRKGHPVLMAPPVVDAVLREPDASTLRDVLARVGYVTVEVEDKGVVFDVDDLDDYGEAKRAYHQDTNELKR